MSAGYQSLAIHTGLSNDAQNLIQQQLDMQVADVHTMMRLPIDDDPGLRAGCNLAAAQVLLSVVSGVSVTLFKRDTLGQRGISGRMFKELLAIYYPWDQEIEASGRRFGADGAADLYNLFRNPLVHALGVVDTDTNEDGRRLMVAKAPMQPVELYELETAGSRQERWLDPTIELNGRTVILRIPSLYWGVREMIDRVSLTPDACAFSFPR